MKHTIETKEYYRKKVATDNVTAEYNSEDGYIHVDITVKNKRGDYIHTQNFNVFPADVDQLFELISSVKPESKEV